MIGESQGGSRHAQGRQLARADGEECDAYAVLAKEGSGDGEIWQRGHSLEHDRLG